MGWHSDDEKIYGENPIIASVTFHWGKNEARPFELRMKNDHKVKVIVPLAHGSIFVMAGTTQNHWQHQVPKLSESKVAKLYADGEGERINLTFRQTKGDWIFESETEWVYVLTIRHLWYSMMFPGIPWDGFIKVLLTSISFIYHYDFSFITFVTVTHKTTKRYTQKHFLT